MQPATRGQDVPIRTKPLRTVPARAMAVDLCGDILSKRDGTPRALNLVPALFRGGGMRVECGKGVVVVAKREWALRKNGQGERFDWVSKR